MTLNRRLFMLLNALLLSGCAGEKPSKDDAPAIKRARGDFSYLHPELPSAYDLLTVNELDQFRHGAPMDEILNAVHWRGTFQEAFEHQGKKVYAIGYVLFTKDPESIDGTAIWAIFIDNKFEKLVKWPNGREKAVGDFRKLNEAFDAKALSRSDIEKNWERYLKESAARPTNWGLGIVLWLFGPSKKAIIEREAKEGPCNADYLQNAKLRDQFNASKLRLGMTSKEVATTLRSPPIESGIVEAGIFEIYGSKKNFKIRAPLHFSNVLVLYRDNKVIGLYGGDIVPGGEDGLTEMREWFKNLPPRPTVKQEK